MRKGVCENSHRLPSSIALTLKPQNVEARRDQMAHPRACHDIDLAKPGVAR
jgi:hypothetical protein